MEKKVKKEEKISPPKRKKADSDGDDDDYAPEKVIYPLKSKLILSKFEEQVII